MENYNYYEKWLKKYKYNLSEAVKNSILIIMIKFWIFIIKN